MCIRDRWNTGRRPREPFMSRQPRSTASSCLYAAARSSGVSVVSEVRSSHLPSRCASRLAAPWSMRSNPALVRRRNRRSPGLVFSDPTSSPASAGRAGVRAVDQVAQVSDEVGPDDCVPFGLFGEVSDHEPLGSGPVVAVAFPRLLAFNAEAWLAEHFNAYLGDPDEYRAILRHLLHLGGHVDYNCLLYTSDAADEEDSVDLGGRRIIKKKKKK